MKMAGSIQVAFSFHMAWQYPVVGSYITSAKGHMLGHVESGVL